MGDGSFASKTTQVLQRNTRYSASVRGGRTITQLKTLDNFTVVCAHLLTIGMHERATAMRSIAIGLVVRRPALPHNRRVVAAALLRRQASRTLAIELRLSQSRWRSAACCLHQSHSLGAQHACLRPLRRARLLSSFRFQRSFGTRVGGCREPSVCGDDCVSTSKLAVSRKIQPSIVVISSVKQTLGRFRRRLDRATNDCATIHGREFR